ncbi:AMP-binding protein [Mycobacterium sp. NPDC050041]|uniref:AMP-binding protein n=1 Tax=Mycobacterium sp. NPDC050041 TaxID=3364293 RepID=UPI003C2AE473
MTITRPGDVTAAEMASLHERVLAVAASVPDREAVTGATGGTTFGRLSEEVRAIAAALSVAGVAPGDVVAVVGTACAEQIPAVLGTLAAGAIYLPVPAGLPAEAALSAMRRGVARMALVCGDLPPAFMPALTVREALRIGAAEAGFAVVSPRPAEPAAILPNATFSHAALLRAIGSAPADPHGRRTVSPGLDCEESVREVFAALLAGVGVAVADRADTRVAVEYPLTFLPPIDASAP